jgi:hypothetical protein
MRRPAAAVKSQAKVLARKLPNMKRLSWSNQAATNPNASVSTRRGLGWSEEVQVTQIALQGQLAKEIERDHKINTLQNQAQQLVKTDPETA